MFPPPHPSLKEMAPQGGIFYDQISRRLLKYLKETRRSNSFFQNNTSSECRFLTGPICNRYCSNKHTLNTHTHTKRRPHPQSNKRLREGASGSSLSPLALSPLSLSPLTLNSWRNALFHVYTSRFNPGNERCLQKRHRAASWFHQTPMGSPRPRPPPPRPPPPGAAHTRHSPAILFERLAY
jgi:hypothetical protein